MPSVMKCNAAEPVLNLQLYRIRLKNVITFQISYFHEGLIKNPYVRLRGLGLYKFICRLLKYMYFVSLDL